MYIYYFYPIFKHVSFTVIGDKHIKLLSQFYPVISLDEDSFPYISELYGYTVIIHPYFYPASRFEEYIVERCDKMKALIGIDVADSDRMSEYAVKLTEYTDAMIVPSNFSRKSYVESGVKCNVHVLPHGVDESYIDAEPQIPTIFKPLYNFKVNSGRRIIQTWVLHSSYRKGMDIAFKIMNILLRERNDVAFLLRTSEAIHLMVNPFNNPFTSDFKMAVSWLNESQIQELMDICDIYLLTSRGGGFEHPALLALARGEIVIAGRGGSWDDYLPDWALTQSSRSGIVLEGSPIHVGCGVEMNVDSAVEMLHGIIDNMDEYRARVRGHVNKHVRENFTWNRIGLKFKEIMDNYI